jgi:hypothetical protein
MCHQSVGLLQGAIEAAGISTISVSVRPEVTVNMRVPRAVYVRFPTGNPVGEPDKPNQQRTILRGILAALRAIREPGTVLEMPYRWKRMGDEDSALGARASRPLPGAGETPALPGREPDLFAVSQAHTAEIQAAYEQLMAAVDRYRAWLEAEATAEQAKSNPDAAKLQALSPQLKYLDELSAALEGPTHDGLVRVSDRAVRIRHWQEGVFV